ncbi:MAG: glycoside hydrolase family 3 C-terminal domain-containing protein [Oscillospiraceae bacterium]|nr:glycoside hydrolase family 3 C-terminal domain-containing protein [Oscillospiraceae bacterium]
MNIRRPKDMVKAVRWSRYRYNLTTNIGENGTRVSGCPEHIALTRKIAGEGMVLLENNGLLPLKPGIRVALFGIGTLDYIQGGGGSGSIYPAYVRNLYEGFVEKAPKISIYEPLSQFYFDYASSHMEEVGAKGLISEPAVPEKLLSDAVRNADVAILVIHRYSGEGWDRSAEKGDFYLTDMEEKLVQDVTGAFAHTVVVLNVGGMVDTSWIRSNPKIDGALLAWQAGMEGGLAIADILCGDVNPSGKLADTFAKEFSDYPSADTFNESDDYVEYFEDIYVGYRYFETLPGAKEKVVYPFGYGLSYTTFALTKPVASQVENCIQVQLTVTNTGACSGKEVVQVYFSAPQGVLGKSRISLAGFQKTALLAPGEKQEITITFPIADMASYDDTGKLCISAYVLEQGDYTFYAGTNCRDLQAADYRYSVSEPYIVTEQLTQKCASNLLSKRMLADGSFEPLPAFPLIHYPAQELPNAVQSHPDKTLPLSAVADGLISLDDFVAQMTEEELVNIVCGIPSRGVANTKGWGGIDRLGIPAVMTVDGPAGVRLKPAVGIPTTAWPCATLLACTWNTDLAYAMGVAGGMECKENGLATWLTPALNIHRNPLCGRNFEYFSEDPLVSGKFAAAQVRGIQSTHTAASAKHFAANNKETNRYYSDSRVSERALREIYLRGFEICVKEAQPWTVMTSYNIINGRRACECFELIEGILRQEWGFDGMVITDWHGPCNQEHCIIAGNDVRMPLGIPDAVREALRHRRIRRSHLVVCAKHILEMILKLD